MLSIDGDLLAVSAIGYKKKQGAVVVFERVDTGWIQAAIITGQDTQSENLLGTRAGDLFGTSISVDGNSILVGASYHDSEGPNHGAAFLFTRNESGWTQTSKLVARIPPEYTKGAKEQ